MDDDMMEDMQESGGYRNALSGLAAGMANGSGNMMPCPMCQGSGMVDSAMLMGEGVPAMSPRLAARGAMGGEMPSGPVPMVGGGMPMPRMGG